MIKDVVDVDVLCANYNNSSFLDDFFYSIENSTSIPSKVIFIDDGSSDNSLGIVKKYQLRGILNILVIPLVQNVGFANALNVGINQLTAKYTLRVDPDDILMPNRISLQYRFMVEHPDVDILGSNVVYFDTSSGKRLFHSNVPISNINIVDTFKNGACGIIHGSSLFKTDWLKRYYYRQESVPAEDYEVFSLMIKDGANVFNLKEALTKVRVHCNSVSNFLPFSTIEKTFTLTSVIWGKNYSIKSIRRQHKHLKYYRLFLFSANPFKRFYYLILASVFNLRKVYNRLLSYANCNK